MEVTIVVMSGVIPLWIGCSGYAWIAGEFTLKWFAGFTTLMVVVMAVGCASVATGGWAISELRAREASKTIEKDMQERLKAMAETRRMKQATTYLTPGEVEALDRFHAAPKYMTKIPDYGIEEYHELFLEQ